MGQEGGGEGLCVCWDILLHLANRWQLLHRHARVTSIYCAVGWMSLCVCVCWGRGGGGEEEDVCLLVVVGEGGVVVCVGAVLLLHQADQRQHLHHIWLHLCCK